MIEKATAVIALLGLIAFVSVVPLYVPEPTLIILTIACVLLAAFDFWRQLFRRRKR